MSTYVFIDLMREDKLESFYEEARSLLLSYLKRNGSIKPYTEQMVTDSIVLNKKLLKRPFVSANETLSLELNVWDYYRAIVERKDISLENNGYGYHINSGYDSWPTWEDWYREVAWFGNRSGAYLYNVIETTNDNSSLRT